MKRHAVNLIASLGILVLSSSAGWSVTLDVSDVIGNHQDNNGVTVVTLNPDPVQKATVPSQAFENAMTNSLAAADWWGSTITSFDWGGSLNGTYVVDVYNAAHKSLFSGGAQFLIRYIRGDGDPLASDLFWIQVVDSNVKNGGETIPYPDVYFSSYPAGQKFPSYFRPDETTLDPNPYVGTADIRNSSYTLNGEEYSYDLAFWDFPSRTADAYWRGELFLASYDEDTRTVTVYDGVLWGFDINTPLPTAFALFLTPAGLLLWRAHRNRPGNRVAAPTKASVT